MNPWESLPTKAPFELEVDAQAIVAFNALARPEHLVRTELVPEPFLGNPTAPVVLLNLNPGFSESDRLAHNDQRFQKAAFANLRHGHSDCPLYLLDRSLPNSPGQDWWRRKLRALTDDVGECAVASQLFVVEIHGYHSAHFSPRLRLPSQVYTREIVVAAINRGAILVVMRGRRHWESLIPELGSGCSVAFVRSVQNPAITPGNLSRTEFSAITAAIAAA